MRRSAWFVLGVVPRVFLGVVLLQVLLLAAGCTCRSGRNAREGSEGQAEAQAGVQAGVQAQAQAEGQIPVLVITDIGTDVDDALALYVLARSPQLHCVGIACTAADAPRRAATARHLLSLLGANTPVGCGPAFIDSVLRATQQPLTVLLLAQATDLTAALAQTPAPAIARIYYQAHATVDPATNRLVPHSESFNVSEDVPAAEALLAFQDRIPFTFVGKQAVYPFAVPRVVFDSLRRTGHPADAYLYNAAHESLRRFALTRPRIFCRVYHIDTTGLNVADSTTMLRVVDTLSTLSNPYDAVTVLALTHPELLQFDSISPGHLIARPK